MELLECKSSRVQIRLFPTNLLLFLKISSTNLINNFIMISEHIINTQRYIDLYKREWLS